MTESEFKNVILDTNFFVDMFRFKVSLEDIEDTVGGDCSFWVVEESVDELKRLRLKEAMVAMRLIDDNERAKEVLGRAIGILRVGRHVATADDAIVSLIKERKELTKNNRIKKDNGAKKRILNFIVATNDAKLRKQIKGLGTKVIYLRARKRLEMA